MLLVTLDIDGTTRRVSDEELSLDHSWFAEISKAPSVKFATSKLYGGFAAPSYGGFTVVPSVFSATPPKTIGVKIEWTEAEESNAITLVEGKGHRASNNRYGVTYNVLKQDYDVTLQATLSDTLTNIFTTYCGASYLDRTLDTSGTIRNPNVYYDVASDTQVIDVLSSIAAFFTHGFYDDGTTIYLYDCLTDKGTLTIDEFDFLPATYTDNQAYSEFKAGDYSVDGSYSYGSEISISPVCHNAQANIEDALTNIKTIVENPGVKLSLPITTVSANIKQGQKISWIDESTGLTAWVRVQSIIYDFAQKVPQIKIEGTGSYESN